MAPMGRKKKGDQEEKVLDVNATMQGALRFDDPVNLRINGKFKGTLDTKGRLMIGEKAAIKANITGEFVQIEGVVTGNIKTTDTLRLTSTARLNGDVETPKLSIEEGAILIGQVRMENATRTGNVSFENADTMNAYQVAEYLEVDAKKVNDWATKGVLPGVMDKDEWMFEKTKVDEWIAQGKVEE